MQSREQKIAENVRAALIEAAKNAYEDAGISGLCAEGRWENALGAMQTLDLQSLLVKSRARPGEKSQPARAQ